MSWIYLLFASLAEMGWPVSLKISQMPGKAIIGWTLAIIFLTISGIFLWLAQREIPIGTAYAVWTGIGATGTFVIGIIFFNDVVSFLRIFSVILIIVGVIGLKIAN